MSGKQQTINESLSLDFLVSDDNITPKNLLSDENKSNPLHSLMEKENSNKIYMYIRILRLLVLIRSLLYA